MKKKNARVKKTPGQWKETAGTHSNVKNLRNIMLSKRSQTQKTIYWGILSGWCFRTGKSKAAEEQFTQGRREGYWKGG